VVELRVREADDQMAVKNCFIRGSVVRYVKMAARNVDTTLLEDATRRGKFSCRVSIGLKLME